jgi:hypothetical protein
MVRLNNISVFAGKSLILSIFLCISTSANAQKLYIGSFYKSGVGHGINYGSTNIFGKLYKND